MRVLVTGGAGYLGSVLTRRLLARGMDVTVLDNMLFGDHALSPVRTHPGLRVVPGDIRDTGDIRSALRDVDQVIHLAAIANDPSGDLDPALTQAVNYDAYAPMLATCIAAGVSRFINASTFSVYGNAHTPNLDESHPLRPLKAYSRCKAEAETVVRDHNREGFTTVSLRCATLCGWSDRMRFDLIANTLAGYALTRDSLTVLGGEQQRPQLHVEDLCDTLIALLDTPAPLIGGEVFNAGGQNASIAQLATWAAETSPRHVQLDFRPARDDERSYSVSSDKLARTLGRTPSRSVLDAMRDIRDAHERGDFADPERSDYHNVRHMAAGSPKA